MTSISAVWDKLDHVVVQLGHCLVECGELAAQS
jgi:hypothetical protein